MKIITKGNKEYQIRFIPESGYPATDTERGSSIVEFTCTTFLNEYPVCQKSGTKRVWFDKDGNVYKWKKSDIKQFTEVAAHRIANFVFHK